MSTSDRRVLPIESNSDVVQVRQAVRRLAKEQGFGIVDQTRLITAASELARNTLLHGGGGRVEVEGVEEHGSRGVRLVFEDRGPGISDVDEALEDGYSTSGGLGLGLGGARRLVSELSIEAREGGGTRVTATRWV